MVSTNQSLMGIDKYLNYILNIMSKLNELKWADIKSSTMNPDEYLKRYEGKPLIIKNFRDYIPNNKVINEIVKLISKNQRELKLLVIGADWCPDCSLYIPKTIKILKLLESRYIKMKILYGVKVNALRKKNEILWSSRRSPPEAISPKFDLQAIPTFYFFNKDGDYLDRIVEHPQKFNTLEEEIAGILEENI
jgi:thiol-disulfide isomerase/thioredoxin